jgi:hypothetical protein
VTAEATLFAPVVSLPQALGPTVREGRHRRVYPELVVHLVFGDLSEHRLGPDTAVGRSLGHLAGWLVER